MSSNQFVIGALWTYEAARRPLTFQAKAIALGRELGMFCASAPPPTA
jgi:hypothetical protein